MKKARFTFGIDGLESWSAIAGLTVFIGLGYEIGPEAWGYVVTGTLLPRELFGSALVAIGVFAEVAIGVFIARKSKREQIKADKKIAELNERAKCAESEAASLQIAVADARERQVHAEQMLVWLRQGQAVRSAMFDFRQFMGVLRDRAKGSVEILYQPEDPEAYALASRIEMCVVGSGWTVVGPTKPVPLTLHMKGVENPDRLPGVLRVGGGMSGVTIVTNLVDESNDSFVALKDAFAAGKIIHCAAHLDASLPKDHIRLVVSPKP
jgi:hypothetical protein